MAASVAGGKIYGVAKKANLHMVAIDFTYESIIKGLDYVSQVGIPYKTVVNLSFGEDSYAYSQIEYDKLKELIQKKNNYY